MNRALIITAAIMGVIVIAIAVMYKRSSVDDESDVFIETTTVDNSSDGSDGISRTGADNESYDSLLMTYMEAGVADVLLVREPYIMSYNRETLCPNWVAWHLTAEHTEGECVRTRTYYDAAGMAVGIGRVTPDMVRSCYIVDMEVPEPRATHDDWYPVEQGMSHGHMCPAADCKWSEEAMNQSNLLSNMCPQTASLNSGGWNRLEEKCRTWAQVYGDIYIVAGPLFYDGVGRTMGEHRIAVPDAFFKVVLCLTDGPKAIGFVYENDMEPHKMADQVCTVDEVEHQSGFDFFSVLDDDIEADVEAHADLKDWR